jgi:hypothetical protein
MDKLTDDEIQDIRTYCETNRVDLHLEDLAARYLDEGDEKAKAQLESAVFWRRVEAEGGFEEEIEER